MNISWFLSLYLQTDNVLTLKAKTSSLPRCTCNVLLFNLFLSKVLVLKDQLQVYKLTMFHIRIPVSHNLVVVVLILTE